MVRVLARVAASLIAASLPVAAQVAERPGIPAGNPVAPQPVGTSAIAKERQGWLADLIKINTSNPPGDEQIAAMYIAGILAKDGIKAEIVDMAPGRSAVVARLRSSAVAQPSRALLLVAHLDTVPVERARWSVDPVGAVVKDGYLYGRGAIDDKGMVAANLAAFISLKRAGMRLSRDVIFLADADEEESGATAGIRALIEKYWDKIGCGFAINEGGRVLLQDGKT